MNCNENEIRFYLVKEEGGAAYVEQKEMVCKGDIYLELMALLGQCSIICKTLFEAVQIADNMNKGKTDRTGNPVQTIIKWAADAGSKEAETVMLKASMVA